MCLVSALAPTESLELLQTGSTGSKNRICLLRMRRVKGSLVFGSPRWICEINAADLGNHLVREVSEEPTTGLTSTVCLRDGSLMSISSAGL